jgi:hypothetical protein
MSLNRSCFKEASRSRLYSTQSGEMLVAEVRRVGAVGSGYVGRVTGVCLSHLGNRMMGVDKDEDKDKDKDKDDDDKKKKYY